MAADPAERLEETRLGARLPSTRPRPRRGLLWRTLFAYVGIQFFVYIPSLVIIREIWRRSDYEVEQRLYWGIAADFARSAQPDLDPALNLVGLRSHAHLFRISYPLFSLYLLDESGKVLLNLSEEGKSFVVGPEGVSFRDLATVSPASIHAFLRSDAKAHTPIFDREPIGGHQTVFSAAPVTFEGKPAFIYITFITNRSDKIEKIYSWGSTFWVIPLALPMVILLCVPIGYLFVSYFTRPLRRIADAIRAYECGKVEQRIEVRSQDEIGEIAQAFNRMADSIASQLADLSAKDRLRRELIADISHDLRAPVSGISAVAQTLLADDTPFDAQRRTELRHVIDERTQALTSLLSELYQLSKLETGEAHIELQRCSVPQLFEDLALSYRVRCQQRSITISTSYAEDCPCALADPAMILRVLTNLLENAIRYTHDGGAITLSCAPSEERLTVEVSDTGVGIDPENLQRVFERTYQVDSQPTAMKGMSGLGLAIVRKIVEGHGGEIAVRSTPNVGTTFSFTVALDGETRPQNEGL